MVLVEPELMGRAVIGSNWGGITEIIQRGHRGFLPWAMLMPLITMLSDRNLSEQMGLVNLDVAKKYLGGREEALRNCIKQRYL